MRRITRIRAIGNYGCIWILGLSPERVEAADLHAAIESSASRHGFNQKLDKPPVRDSVPRELLMDSGMAGDAVASDVALENTRTRAPREQMQLMKSVVEIPQGSWWQLRSLEPCHISPAVP
jgi:hypothetical protein